jgi:hypothetical protein
MAMQYFILKVAGWADFHRLLCPAIRNNMRWQGPR